jgi:hypothetical protein
MIEQVRQSKETMALIKQKLGVQSEKEGQETEVEDAKQVINEVKQLFRSLKIDFENEEVLVRTTLWKKEVALLMDENSSFSVDAEEFKALSTEFVDLRLKKDEGPESVWFQETRSTVNEVVKKLSKMNGDSELDDIKTFIREKKELAKIKFEQLMEDKTAKINLNMFSGPKSSLESSSS